MSKPGDPPVANVSQAHLARRLPVDRLLRPRAVAIIGASATKGSLGASLIGNLDRFGFAGDLHLVNPNRDFIGARPCIKSVQELPLDVDVAVLAIPKAAVLGTLRALVERRIGAAIIFAAGFAEGGEAGSAEQAELKRLASEHNVLIVGPNCLGLVNYIDRVPLTFVETLPLALHGSRAVAIISQSGAMAVVLGVMLSSRGVELSYSISTGNEAGSGVEDYLEYLLDHEQTTVFALIVEQFRKPRRFLEIAQQAAARGKTLVLLHPGRSAAARESAATHTGAIAGDYRRMRTQVEHRGVLVADDLQQFGDIIEIVCRAGIPTVPGTVVLTESGAFKALTLDFCEQVALELPLLTDMNSPELRKVVPDFVPVSNPIDLTAQGLVDPGIYQRALAALMPDPRFGALVLGIIQTDETTSAAKFPTILGALGALAREKVVIFAGLDEGATVPPEYIQKLRTLGVPYFASPERAYSALARLLGRVVPEFAPVRDGESHRLTAQPPSGVVPEYLSKRLLRAVGIPFPDGRVVQSLEEAHRALAELGTRVALKAQSAALSHKSDAGGVILGVDEENLDEAWVRLHENLARNCPDLQLDGVLVEVMSPKGVELIIGARNDPEWGATLLAGFGGVDAEIRQDFVLLPAGLSRQEITRRLSTLQGAPLLHGFRGSAPCDVASVAEIIVRLAALLLAEPSIREIDLNPVIVFEQGRGVLALDALMVVD